MDKGCLEIPERRERPELWDPEMRKFRKMKAQDATLDALVAEMNAAKTSKAPDAMEKPMAAVLNELVAQRKAQRAMMMEMQPEMMAHMGRHMGMKMHGGEGGMDCPMMKSDDAAAPVAMEKKPKT